MKAVIGLEIHVQLTEAGTKLFCDCEPNYRGMRANTDVCPVCIGLPGALPVAGRRPVVLALAVAKALKCEPPSRIVFTRKHYIYPDLPKNYQITQYERVGGAPICTGGALDYYDPSSDRWGSVRIRRVNLEEDPGKTSYLEGGVISSPYALVDYNRSGVPLLEIVTEPDISSPREARYVVEYLLLVLDYIGATNPRLEGAFRVDANISLEGGERVEVKNLGSIVDVEKALSYEIHRQKRLLSAGGRVARETRHWDPVKGVTKPLRHKEYEEEYLYFPDPDLPPIEVTNDLIEEASRLSLENPSDYFRKIVSAGVPGELAWSIVSVKASSRIFVRALDKGSDPLILAKIMAVDYKGELRNLNRDQHDESSWPPPDTLAELVRLVKLGKYTYDTVKGIIIPMLAKNPRESLDSLLPEPVTGVESVIEEVLRSEEKAVEDYLRGKEKALNYLVGAVIRRVGKKALDPRDIRRKIVEALKRYGQP